MSSNNARLCPHCRRLVSRDAPSCPHCGLSRPGSSWKGLVGAFSQLEPERLIRLLIGINVLMYILSLLLSPQGVHTGMMNPFRLLSPDNRVLLQLGASGTVPIKALGHWWSLISANYLHGGLLHIIFNMMALHQLGPLVIREYGLARMTVIYTAGGVGGYLVSYLVGIPFTLGASAAICALIGAILYYGKSRGGAYGGELFSQVGGWAIGIGLFGLLVPGINNWAHGGGILGGALLGYLLGYRERGRESFTQQVMAAGCALLTAAILLWAVAGYLFA